MAHPGVFKPQEEGSVATGPCEGHIRTPGVRKATTGAMQYSGLWSWATARVCSPA
jgi:hypothetical protein